MAENNETQRDPWLDLAIDAYNTSTTYVDQNYRQQWENNLLHFKGKHHNGSKYYTPSYKYRSKFFRPKTRAMVRQNEAAAAAAFFTNSDVLSVEPFDKTDKEQAASAELREGILNHHLQNTIPWYLTLVGGMQDAQVQGVVCSKQYWEYSKRKEVMTDRQTGEDVEVEIVEKNQPAVKLWPVEMLRFDPAANWIDPVNTSPYLIGIEPMYIHEVKEKIESGEFGPVTDEQFASAIVSDYDSTRSTREGRQDSQEQRHSGKLSDFDKVYVYEVIIRRKGQEIHYYTLGTVVRLTKPRPLREVYFHGKRPFVIGCVIVETHNPMPPAPVELTAPIQKETNEIVNSRIDNVKLALNKRYIVKRGQQVDLQSLIRNAAGSITLANNPDQDVREMEFNDVTGSSYAEQDRLNLDMDELIGTFSNSSVQANRKMNETVGGMAMLRSAAGGMTQYLINVFSETWVEKVLRQLDMLVQYYEDNIDLIMLVAREGNIINRYKVEITPKLMRHPAKVVVNVTNSATDPMIRLEQFLNAVEKYNGIASTATPDMDLTEIRKEIFGKLGYKNGARFFMDEDDGQSGMIKQLQAQLQMMTKAIEDQAAKADAEMRGKAAIAQLQEQNKAAIAQLQEQNKLAIAQIQEQGRQTTEREKMIHESNLTTRKLIAEREKAKLQSDTTLITAKMSDNTNQLKLGSMPGKESPELKQINELKNLIAKVQNDETGEKNEVKQTIEEMRKARESNIKTISSYLKKKNNPELNKVLEELQ